MEEFYECSIVIPKDEVNILTPDSFKASPIYSANSGLPFKITSWERIIKGLEISGECVLHNKKRISYMGNRYQTRRLFFLLFNSKLEKNSEVKTTCGVHDCVYPPHLVEVPFFVRSDKATQFLNDTLKGITKKMNRTEKSKHYNLSKDVIRSLERNKTDTFIKKDTKNNKK